MNTKATRNLFDELNEGFDALAAQRAETARELSRLDRGRELFRQYLLEGVKSQPTGRMDAGYFADLSRSQKTRGKPKV